MKRKILCTLLALGLLLSGCGTGQETAAPSDTAVTFTDDLGRSVTVDRPERVAALLGSFAQIWQLAGGDVVAAADDAWEDLHLTLDEDTVNLGSTESLSLELLLETQPDFILASPNRRQNVEWQETLENIGISVAYFDVSGFEDYLRVLQLCTDITGRADRYEEYGAAVERQIDEILQRRRTDSPTVLSMIASASMVRAKNSESNVLGAMLKAMGCVNIADSGDMDLSDLSMEYILQADPDYIFIVQRGDDEEGMRAYVQQFLMDHPAWSKLTAVQNGRVYFMEKTLYNLKPNHRWGEAYAKLEEILNHE